MAEATELKMGLLWFRRQQVIEGWSSKLENPEAWRHLDQFLRETNYNRAQRGMNIAGGLHPTLLGELFNALLDAVLVIAQPTNVCSKPHGEDVLEHHAHDGRIPCEVVSLAENFRVPYV